MSQVSRASLKPARAWLFAKAQVEGMRSRDIDVDAASHMHVARAALKGTAIQITPLCSCFIEFCRQLGAMNAVREDKHAISSIYAAWSL
ncbi:hypothetical protein D1Y84_04550 [Acidipila sp. EB88]|nr:hypothetical protein D1Y84_04550 [Acidipila sp. EB88]